MLAVSLCTGVATAQQPPVPYPAPPPPPRYPPQPYPQQPHYPQPYQQPYPQPYPQQPYPQQPYPQQQFPPPPAPQRLVSERHIDEPIYGLVIGGGLLFGVSYVLPLIAAIASDFSNSGEWVAIPLFGPLVTMGERQWGEDDEGIGAGLVLAAVYQTAGAAMFAAGLAFRRTRVERTYAFVPVVNKDGVGFMLRGAF